MTAPFYSPRLPLEIKPGKAKEP